eukprot:TRINITY_DN4952_c0_g1_i4.p1 TRINITY_DN4952_c0_g1~~TRINITY_DN4952_c0_g1_i4.p1  ORF type:complete len:277 (-),score=79.65 TRINITY_DN4952_c0_g1_i4:227-976(-)
MCIRDRYQRRVHGGICVQPQRNFEMIKTIAVLFVVACLLGQLHALNYDQCDGQWGEDIIFAYQGPDCLPPPGCDTVCARVCWRGSITLCSSLHGSLISMLSNILSNANVKVDGALANPRNFNNWLFNKNGYVSEVKPKWSVVETLGLKLAATTKKSEEAAAYFGQGKTVLALNKSSWVMYQRSLGNKLYEVLDSYAKISQKNENEFVDFLVFEPVRVQSLLLMRLLRFLQTIDNIIRGSSFLGCHSTTL